MAKEIEVSLETYVDGLKIRYTDYALQREDVTGRVPAGQLELGIFIPFKGETTSLENMSCTTILGIIQGLNLYKREQSLEQPHAQLFSRALRELGGVARRIINGKQRFYSEEY